MSELENGMMQGIGQGLVQIGASAMQQQASQQKDEAIAAREERLLRLRNTIDRENKAADQADADKRQIEKTGAISKLIKRANEPNAPEVVETGASTSATLPDGTTAQAPSTMNAKGGAIDKLKPKNAGDIRRSILESGDKYALDALEVYEKSRTGERSDKADERADKQDKRQSDLSDVQLTKLQQDIDEGKVKLKYLSEGIRLDLDAKRANINQSNAATASSNASTAKTKQDIDYQNKNGNPDKLPADVKLALWYEQATPAQKSAFDNLNDKSPKVTADGAGGFIINKKDGFYKMNNEGVMTKIKQPDEKQAPPANRPPLSSFNK